MSGLVKGWSRLRPLLVLLLLGLQGCAPATLLNREILYVMVVTQRELEWIRYSADERGKWKSVIGEFQRLHPNVHVSLLTVPEDQVETALRVRTSRGLGPDLILVRAPMANTLLKAGLIAPVPHTPAMASTIAQVAPRFLRRVQLEDKLAGLPVYDEVCLACYNRRAIPSPPRTTEALRAMAAAGATIGLSIDPYGIWWTAGTQDADGALLAVLLDGRLGENSLMSSSKTDERNIIHWLDWLRSMALQSRVDVASGPEELTNGLISGRLDWIPCFSRTLGILKAGMGDKLGVGILPGGPGGPPSPFNTLRVWSFGLDSSAQQRERASAFVQLSIDPLLQRRYVLESQEVLPVSRIAQTPVASSGILAALAAAQQQFEVSSPLMSRPFTVEHLSTVEHELESIIQEVMMGSLSSKQGFTALMQLRKRPR